MNGQLRSRKIQQMKPEVVRLDITLAQDQRDRAFGEASCEELVNISRAATLA